MRRNQTRHSTDRRGLERWNQHAEREQLYIGVKVLPSHPPLLYHSSFLVFFFFLHSTYLFIYLFFFISKSLPPLPAGCGGGGHSPNKVERSQRGSDRNKETEREHSYSQDISISPKEYQLNWYRMNPTPPSLHSHSSPLSFLPDLSQGVTVSYSLICVNPCFRQHCGWRATPQSEIRWAGVAAWLPDSGSSAEARHSEWWVRNSWEKRKQEKKEERGNRGGKREGVRERGNLLSQMVTLYSLSWDVAGRWRTKTFLLFITSCNVWSWKYHLLNNW